MESDNNFVKEIKQRSKTIWALGSYGDIATSELPPLSAHLIRAANIQRYYTVLDVACGTGVTTITAAGKVDTKVTGLDITPQLLIKAKEEAKFAGIENINWKEGDAEDLPFSDNSFDVVLSSFGHMFAPRPEVVAQELVRVTKVGGRIAFATWPAELAVGKMFEVMMKYVSLNFNDTIPSPMQWGIPNIIQKRLGTMVKDVHFERGALNIPLLSPNYYWLVLTTKFGPMIDIIQTLSNEIEKIESLRKDFINCIIPFIHENMLKLDYLITVAKKV